MQRPDEGTIHAWLDGELDAAESARVEALVASDPAWAAAAAEARGLIAAGSRIVGALDHVPGRVVPAPRRKPASRWWMARVAALLVIVAGTAIVWRREPVPMIVSTPTIVDERLAVSPAAPLQSVPVPAPPSRPSREPARETRAKVAAREPLVMPAAPVIAAPPPPSASASGAAAAPAPMAMTNKASSVRDAAEPPRVLCYQTVGMPVPRLLALTDRPAARFEALAMRAMASRATPPAASSASAPAVGGAGRPLEGEIRGERADTVSVSWREGAQTFRVRALALGDSLVEARSTSPDSLTGGFRAVRAACPAP